MAATDAPTGVLGSSLTSYTGYSGYGWPVDELEHVPDMAWPKSIQTLTQMRTDATCQSILAVYWTALTAAPWHINPAGADPEAVRVCSESLGLPVKGEDGSDIGAVRRRGVKWSEHVRLANLHLLYGHFAFECVYEIREDGYAYLKALPERLPSTIDGININPDGTLKSITQAGVPGAKNTNTYGAVEIPADRLLFYTHDREGALFTGRSILRPAYTDWRLKIDAKRANAIAIGRWSAGIPVAEPEPGTNPTPAQIAEAQRMVSSARGGEVAGAVPVGFRMRIMGIDGQIPDAIPTLNYYDMQMARSALTSLLDLGNTATGSRALGDNFSDVMTRALQAIGEQMAETASQLCVRLTTYNFGEDAVPPVVSVGDVGASKATITQSIANLLAAGAITPDESLEAYAREAYHLPAKVAPAPVVDVPVEDVAAQDSVTLAASGWDSNKGNISPVIRWYEHGEGAALIRWGTSNDHARCVAIASRHMTVEQAHGFCQLREKAVTGEYTSQHAKRVRGAEGDPQPYRELTPQEQAAGVDPQAVDEAQDGLVAEGMALFAAIVAVWGAALASQITAGLAAGSLAALARLRVDSTDAAQGLAVLMREAADAGVLQVANEARRAGIPASPDRPVVDEAALDDAAAAAADLMGQGLASAAGREAARLAGPDSDPKTVAREAVATVTESDTPIHDAIQAGVTRAMGAGRAAAQQALMLGADLVPFSSAIRDVNSCQPCLDNDGREYPDLTAALADFPTGHYSACLGRSRCRCQIHLRPVTS